MKKILVALALAFYATSSFAVVENSKHDFNASATYGTNQASRCQYCHVPHRAQTWASVALWATGQATGSPTYYSSANVVVTSVDIARTQTCLACHADGQTTTTYLLANVSGNALIGYDLRTSHPVGDQVTFTPGSGSSWKPTVYMGYQIAGTTTVSIQCATCHSVHGLSDRTIIGRKLLFGGSATTASNPGGWPTSTDFCTICHNR